MSRTYRRCSNKTGKPKPSYEFYIWSQYLTYLCMPYHRFISDNSYQWARTHYLKEEEHTNRRAKTRMTIRNILIGRIDADEAIFTNINNANPWDYD